MCPFIRLRTNKSISCEGPIPGTVCKNTFSRAADQETQYRVFCCARWENCEIARAVTQKYEEDDD